MAKQFEGRWKMTTPIGKSDNFEKFHDELGTDKTMLGKFSESWMEQEYKNIGDNRWSCSVIIDGSVMRDYQFTIDEESELEGIDGFQHKFLCKMDGDTWVEDTTPCNPGKKGFVTKKKVSGSTMTVEAEIKGSGVKSTFEMVKVSK